MSNVTRFVNDQIENQNDYIKVVRCKECKYSSGDGTYGCMCDHYEAIDDTYHRMYADDYCSYGDRKTEPQTYVINPQEPTNNDKCFECDDFFTCGGQCNKIEDEPQTDCAWGRSEE